MTPTAPLRSGASWRAAAAGRGGGWGGGRMAHARRCGAAVGRPYVPNLCVPAQPARAGAGGREESGPGEGNPKCDCCAAALGARGGRSLLGTLTLLCVLSRFRSKSSRNRNRNSKNYPRPLYIDIRYTNIHMYIYNLYIISYCTHIHIHINIIS